MKIGIMTFFRPINYGAYLQAYALSHRLNQENDMDAEIINFHMPAEDKFYIPEKGRNVLKNSFNKKRYKVFRDSLSQQLLSKEECCGGMKEYLTFVNGKYDVIIAGSDEIWKVDGYRGFPTSYFLPGDLNCKKVSYAASGRTPFHVLPDDAQKLLREYFNDFDYIGVRDEATFKEVQAVVDQKEKLHLNFDPSFVYDFQPDKENGKKLLKKYFRLSGKKVIAVLYNEGFRSNPSLARSLKSKYGKEFDFISLYEWSAFLQDCPLATPMEWKDMLAAVDGVISMYFHGICFSLIGGTPFLAIEKRSPNSEQSKLYDILQRLSMEERYSFGLKATLEGKRLDAFIQEIREGKRLDPTPILAQAQEEFCGFVKDIRDLSSRQ